jgi:ferredoxin
MLAAQIGTLVAGTTESAGIRFVCSRGVLAPEAGWFDVEVPCTSMVPGTWLLACIALGTGSVALIACDESGCPLGLDETALESTSFARRLLTSYGLNPDLVGTGHGPVPVPLPALEVSDPFGTKGPATVLLALAAATGKFPVVVEAGSPVGVVEIDAATCTLCAQCATTCPTDALADRYEDGRISITFDAADCVNCRQCVSACPEIERGAIAVSPRVDTNLLVAGRNTLNEGSVIMCERCGNAIAPDTMMNRISDLLGDEFQNTMEFLSTRCLDCRGQG